MKEIWKDIKEYEGLYQVSNIGRIKSFVKFNGGMIINPSKDTHGYLRIGLVKNKERVWFAVHRLVAIAFISNPERKRTVNHKNGIKTDNKVKNLEWMSHSENNKHAFDTGLKEFARELKSKIVLNLENGIYYNSAKEASESINVNYGTLKNWLNGRYTNKSSMVYV